MDHAVFKLSKAFIPKREDLSIIELGCLVDGLRRDLLLLLQDSHTFHIELSTLLQLFLSISGSLGEFGDGGVPVAFVDEFLEELAHFKLACRRILLQTRLQI